jgi:hypothetical protein
VVISGELHYETLKFGEESTFQNKSLAEILRHVSLSLFFRVQLKNDSGRFCSSAIADDKFGL